MKNNTQQKFSFGAPSKKELEEEKIKKIAKNVKLPGVKMNIKQYLKLHIAGGWVLSFILIAFLIGGGFVVNGILSRSAAKMEEMVEYNDMMGNFFITWQETIARQATHDQIRTLYISYGADLIIRHYQRNNIAAARRMTSEQMYTMLNTIYLYATSGVYPNANFPDGLFLPLAYAVVETDFVNTAIGGDGERSVFQIMESTARQIFADAGTAYVPNWWLCQQTSVWMWFQYHRTLSGHFIHEDQERQVRWTALAYNAGLYRNQLLRYFSNGSSIDTYLSHFPIRRGISTYNSRIYVMFKTYQEGFKALPTGNIEN